MNPISIRIYHGNTSQVVTNHFCNMCLTEGEHGVEAESIFVAIELKKALNWTIYLFQIVYHLV